MPEDLSDADDLLQQGVKLSSAATCDDSLQDRATKRVVLLSSGFVLVFTSFNVVQNLETSLNASLGFWALAAIYISFSLTNVFLAAPFTIKFGSKISIPIGAIAYVVFTEVHLNQTPVILMLAAILEGIGAAILWTAHGTYLISVCPSDQVGKYTGMFFCIFYLNQLIGNLLVAILLELEFNTSVAFIILTLICASGVLLLTCLEKPTKTPPKRDFHIGKRLKEMGSFVAMRDVQLLLVIVAYWGFEQAYMYGFFPAFIDVDDSSSDEATTKDIQLKCVVMAVCGLLNALGSATSGRLSDRIGRKSILCSGFVIHSLAFILALTNLPSPQSTGMYFVISGLLGLGDGCWATQTYGIVSDFHSDQLEIAFATLKAIQSMATGVAFLVFRQVDVPGGTLSVWGLLFSGCLCLVILDRFVRPLHRHADDQEVDKFVEEAADGL